MSWTFFREFLRNWQSTGAIAPSSRYLAQQIVRSAGVGSALNILEVGPGTGSFTREISRAMSPEARYVGLELNSAFVNSLKQQFPSMQFEAVAAQDFDFQSYLGSQPGFDAIISGLPWTAFPVSLQTDILDHILGRLKPGGVFVTFAYAGFHLLPGGQRFRSLLAERCHTLQTTRTVWRNAPPAFVYQAISGPAAASR